jgi:hypothetical protein
VTHEEQPEGEQPEGVQPENVQPEEVPPEDIQPEPAQSEDIEPESAQSEEAPTVTWRGVAKNLVVVAIFLVFTLVVGVAFAYYGTSSIPGGNGAAAATSVSQGATPIVTAGIGSVTVTWSATSLGTGRAVTGYTIKRYDAATLTAQTIQTACTGVIATTTCTESGLPTGQWQYTVTPRFATSWLGPESAKSATVATVVRDTITPVNAVTLSEITGGAVQKANTIYYKGSAAGSFRLTNAVADSGSGPASSTTQALTGTTTGWSHTPSTVKTPEDGPYVSSPFSWVAGTASAPVEALVGRDVQENATTTSLTFVNDSTGPQATVASTDGYTPRRSVPVTFTATETQSGVATGRQLQRASAPLATSGACGTFSSYTKIGPLDPTSVYTDTQVTNGSCYKYRYLVRDVLGNETTVTSTSVSKVDYGRAVSGTSGLLSQWRLGELEVARDTFTGYPTFPITFRSGELGASWTKWSADSSAAELTFGNALRRNAVGGVTYLASGVPTNADYQVSADVLVRSVVSLDSAGVVGRVNTSVTTGQGTRYVARYNVATTSWQLIRYLNNSQLTLGSSSQAVSAGQSFRLSLDMRGTSIRLLVDGVPRVTVTDSAISSAGRGGVRMGDGTTGTAPTNFGGLHLDNFGMSPPAVDSRGSNPGFYVNQPTLDTPGALVGDTDTAATFNGVDQYVQMLNTTGLPLGASVRSVEGWFRTTSAKQQTLFNYGSRGNNQEFGLWLAAGGSSMVAWGFAGDRTFTLPTAVNDGQWHQVVKTYDGTAITLYIDGVGLPPQAVARDTVIDAYGFGIGAVIVPGDANSGYPFQGSLDEVSFYTTVLTQAVVDDHYALGGSPVADAAGPTGGSVSVIGLVGTGSRYSTSTTLDVELASGADPSGIGDSGAQLLRATATLTSANGTANGTCGAFGAYTLLDGGEDPTSPVVDTVADQACYSYRYVVPDSLGNTTTYTSEEVKVETTGPSAPTLAFSATTNTSWSGSGSTVFYRPAATTGSFTATASATDARSGIASYAFPVLGTNWTSTPGAPGVTTYSWSGTPAAPGTKGVTATNHASVTSASSPFTLTADSTAPTAGTVSYPATSADPSVNVSFTTGTDPGSGVGTRLLQRASATLTGTTCGAFGGFTTVAGGTNPTSPLTNAVTSGTCYTYRYVVSDQVGNSSTASSATVLKVQSASYVDTVQATAGLVSHWRLGDSGASDTFTGTAGAVLSTRAADSGSTWTRRPGDAITAVLTNQGRLRKSSASGGVAYYISDRPASADYLVEVDVHVKSMVGTAGVMGRMDPNGSGTGTYYFARYDAGSSQWQLIKNVNGSPAIISTYYQPLTVGTTYRLTLDMKGTALRVLVNGVQRIFISDGSITAAGRSGVGLGEPGDAAAPSDTQGLHLDNFGDSVELVDSYGTNNGSYVNGPTRGTAGALTGDSDTAVTFDGVAQHGTVARQISDDLSIEFWFSSTQGIGTGTQWWQGAGLVDAEVGGATSDFGVALRSDGRVVGGIGSSAGDVSIVSSTSGLNDGSWHHVVFTRVQATGAIRLYVDGALVQSGTAGTDSLTARPSLTFGRLATGGNAYAGSLDEIAVYNTALTAGTVTSHYASR